MRPQAPALALSPVRQLVPFLPYLLIATVHVAFVFTEHPLASPTKLLLMPLLALGVLWATAGMRPWPKGALIVLLLGIGFSWLGDGSSTFFPMFADEVPMMLLNFGLAHVAYVLLMLRGRDIARRRIPPAAAAYVLAYIALMFVLIPHTGGLSVAVLCYGALLVATAAIATRCGPVIAWGGFWFLVSDAILSFRIFTPEAMPAWTSGAVMLTYTVGQGLIAAGVVGALARRAGSPSLRPERHEV